MLKFAKSVKKPYASKGKDTLRTEVQDVTKKGLVFHPPIS